MEILSLFEKGGLVMYPLLLCSIIAIAILVERVRTYGQAKSNMGQLKMELPSLIEAGKWSDIQALCKEDGGVPAELVAEATTYPRQIERQQIAIQSIAGGLAGRLRAYLNYLETIVTLAPLLGLLGTVTGMIGSFSVLSVAGGEPFAITDGVGEALIATATGLCVAIIALVIHSFLVQKQDEIITDMEEISSLYLGVLAGDANEL